MYRTHTCGELRISNASQTVTLAGWVQTVRKFGSITFVDLRDRYGITQLLFGEELTVVQWALIGVLFLAGILVNLDEKFSIKSVLNRNILLAFAWILSSVWFNSMIKYASLTNGFWEVSLWPAVIAVIIYLPTLPLFYKELIRTKPSHHVGIAITTMLYTA